MADSIDFLEDTAVNTLIFLALFWSLKARSWAGYKAMAVIICAPALVAAWQIASQFSDPQAPDPLRLVLTAGAPSSSTVSVPGCWQNFTTMAGL